MCICAVIVGEEIELHGFGGGGEAVLDGEEKPFVFSDEVGVAIAESVEVAGAPEGLSELSSVFFAHVMYEDDGHVELSLQLSEKT